MHITKIPHQSHVEINHNGRLHTGKLYIANNGTRVLYGVGEDWVYSPTLDELYLSKPDAPQHRLPAEGWEVANQQSSNKN